MSNYTISTVYKFLIIRTIFTVRFKNLGITMNNFNIAHRKVDAEILKVIEQRKKVCMARAGVYGEIDCKHLLEQYEQCEQAWHIKCKSIF